MQVSFSSSAFCGFILCGGGVGFFADDGDGDGDGVGDGVACLACLFVCLFLFVAWAFQMRGSVVFLFLFQRLMVITKCLASKIHSVAQLLKPSAQNKELTNSNNSSHTTSLDLSLSLWCILNCTPLVHSRLLLPKPFFLSPSSLECRSTSRIVFLYLYLGFTACQAFGSLHSRAWQAQAPSHRPSAAQMPAARDPGCPRHRSQTAALWTADPLHAAEWTERGGGRRERGKGRSKNKSKGTE